MSRAIIASCLFIWFFGSGCQPIVDTRALNSTLAAPPIWKVWEDSSIWLAAAIIHAQQLVNDVNADQTQYWLQLDKWGIDRSYLWLETHDLDHDRIDELILSYPLLYVPLSYESSPSSELASAVVSRCETGNCRRLVLIFVLEQGVYVPAAVLGDPVRKQMLNAPEIFAVEDINGDDVMEMVLLEHWQGASVDGSDITIGQWREHQWVTVGFISQNATQVQLLDLEQDQIKEVIFYGGLAGSAGAGLGRKYTDIYKWNGTTYQLAAHIPDSISSQDSYWKMVDGNIALAERHYETALQLFAEALTLPADQSIASASFDVAIVAAVSRFQQMFIFVARDQADVAKVRWAEIQTLDAGYAAWSNAFWAEYSQSNDLDAACVAARRSSGDAWMEGYNYITNPMLIAEILCYPDLKFIY